MKGRYRADMVAHLLEHTEERRAAHRLHEGGATPPALLARVRVSVRVRVRVRVRDRLRFRFRVRVRFRARVRVRVRALALALARVRVRVREVASGPSDSSEPT